MKARGMNKHMPGFALVIDSLLNKTNTKLPQLTARAAAD